MAVRNPETRFVLQAFGVPEGRYKDMRNDFEAAAGQHACCWQPFTFLQIAKTAWLAGLLICKSTGKMFQAVFSSVVWTAAHSWA